MKRYNLTLEYKHGEMEWTSSTQILVKQDEDPNIVAAELIMDLGEFEFTDDGKIIDVDGLVGDKGKNITHDQILTQGLDFFEYTVKFHSLIEIDLMSDVLKAIPFMNVDELKSIQERLPLLLDKLNKAIEKLT